MKSVQDTYLLHNGVAIPCVGYGTCDTDGEVTVRSVKCALQAGYRLIDTAMFYKNEESVGKGIRESGVPREEITVVSKLWNYDHSYESEKILPGIFGEARPGLSGPLSDSLAHSQKRAGKLY